MKKYLKKMAKSKKLVNRSSNGKEIFIFLAGLNFWEGLFDNANIKFIRNLFELRLVNFSQMLMTIITSKHLSSDKYKILLKKEEQIQKIALEYRLNIEFYHIEGRAIRSVLRASKEIREKTVSYEKRFIWSTNYFNCFIGILVKNQLPDTYLHFEMIGLAPEEELFYSESNIIFRLTKFLILRILGRIDVKRADSVSVVSKQFKDYIISKYRLSPEFVEVVPCYYDNKVFFSNKELRRQFRLKYQINDHQKLFLYSGMLQKWQMPELLFAFFKKMQMQDKNHEFRFMIITFDQKKAQNYAAKHEIKDLIIDAVSGNDLNGVYNAGDIGIATRTSDLVSNVSSPVKIPEYLATKNSLILLESIGDYGVELKHKKYTLVKKNKKDLLNTTVKEISLLEKPDEKDLTYILENFSIQGHMHVIKKIFAKTSK